jgi:predicted GIY-YIG superfamily endonuclease/3-methyladenine DNA glycosylase AlkD
LPTTNLHTAEGDGLARALARYEHWMYVVRCVDGSLYTGYATNVSRRVQTHNAGRGAKYTRMRRPVELVAAARFYTKERAMSAEARFKMLDRAQKESLLAQAAMVAPPIPDAEDVKGPKDLSLRFEDVLTRDLPGFADEPPHEFIARELATNVDAAYRDFQLPLMPSVDSTRMLGVRTPALRQIAKKVMQRSLTCGQSSKCSSGKLNADGRSFLKMLPHATFEEMQIHSFMIASLPDANERLEQYKKFIPYIDNWATCDQLATSPLMQDATQAYDLAVDWTQSFEPYTVRFGVLVLMRHFLEDSTFSVKDFEIVANAGKGIIEAAQDGGVMTKSPSPPSPIYYVCMARAWFFAEAAAKQPKALLSWFRPAVMSSKLDTWTARKAIQKAIESRKVAPEVKAKLKTLRKDLATQ